MRLSLIFVGLIFLSSTVQPKSLRSRIIKMKIRIPASEVSHAQWIAWKENLPNLLSYIAFQIGRALSKKMDRTPNLGKTTALPVLPMAAALTQPINDDPDKPQTRKNTISNRWVRLWYLIKHIFFIFIDNFDDSVACVFTYYATKQYLVYKLASSKLSHIVGPSPVVGPGGS